MMRDDATMSLLEHLEELRSRIIVIAIAVLVAAIAGFFLADPIITLLRAPLEDTRRRAHPDERRRGVQRPADARAHVRHRASRCR